MTLSPSSIMLKSATASPGLTTQALLQFVLIDREGAHGALESEVVEEAAFYAESVTCPTPELLKC